MKSIVWLASYPKSGNTWLRAFLANYIHNGEQPIPLNRIPYFGTGDAKFSAYKKKATEPFDGTDPAQCTRLRPAVLQSIVSNRADVNFVKTHCENSIAFGVKLIPAELTRSAIYIMRNPLDLMASYASHYGLPMDRAITSVGRRQNSLKGGGGNIFRPLGSWSSHVVGWVKAKKFPVLTIRYEDMHKAPHEVFDRVVRHIGLPHDPVRIEKAVRFSDFKILRKQEDETPFIEKSSNSDQFFRHGKAGQWKSELSAEQVARILQDHGRVMKKHGYKT